MPEELEKLLAGPPAGTESLWLAYMALSGCRGSSGFGVAPVSLSSILAYAQLHKIEFTTWEVDVLLELDTAVMKVLSKKG